MTPALRPRGPSSIPVGQFENVFKEFSSSASSVMSEEMEVVCGGSGGGRYNPPVNQQLIIRTRSQAMIEGQGANPPEDVDASPPPKKKEKVHLVHKIPESVNRGGVKKMPELAAKVRPNKRAGDKMHEDEECSRQASGSGFSAVRAASVVMARELSTPATSQQGTSGNGNANGPSTSSAFLEQVGAALNLQKAVPVAANCEADDDVMIMDQDVLAGEGLFDPELGALMLENRKRTTGISGIEDEFAEFLPGSPTPTELGNFFHALPDAVFWDYFTGPGSKGERATGDVRVAGSLPSVGNALAQITPSTPPQLPLTNGNRPGVSGVFLTPTDSGVFSTPAGVSGSSPGSGLHLTPPGHGAPLTPPGHGALLTPPGHGAPLTPPGHGAPLTPPGHGALLTPPGHGALLTPPGHGAPLTPPGHGAPLTPPVPLTPPDNGAAFTPPNPLPLMSGNISMPPPLLAAATPTTLQTSPGNCTVSPSSFSSTPSSGNTTESEDIGKYVDQAFKAITALGKEFSSAPQFHVLLLPLKEVYKEVQKARWKHLVAKGRKEGREEASL